MGDPKTAETAAALRLLPSTDELMSSPAVRALADAAGRPRLASLARAALDELRKELADSVSTKAGRERTYSRESLLADAAGRVDELWRSHRAARLRRVINATGVVVHTNLGRAPLSPEAIGAIRDASGYSTVEYDLASGRRGRRGAHVERMLAEVSGAEAALVVNNCAAAAFLVLTVLAKGGEVVVSRGELVEIGGDFRIPDVLTQSGATLKEVGTTNRTKLPDYEKAIGENTRLLMSVHPSNYRIVGFTEKPDRTQLAELAHRKKVIFYEDSGSGALSDLTEFGLGDEPVIQQVVADGTDVVTFSGDKLVGGSQAGIIVGRRDLVEQIRKHPLYRALRVDKLIYAALQATLESYLRGSAVKDVPVLRMIAETKDELDQRVRPLAQRMRDALGDHTASTIRVIDGDSVIGGGAAPAVRRPTSLLAFGHPSLSTTDVEARLRRSDPPIIARIENDQVVVDLRTVHPDEEQELFEGLVKALSD